MHGVSFVLHLINGILGLVALDAAGSRPPKILSTRFVYRNASAVPLNETGCGESCSPAYGDLVATRRARCLFAYDGLLVLALSELATALWQLFYIVEIMVTALTFQRDECHGLRWCEYALTATAISLGQLVGTGEREVSTVLIASAALVSLQMLGWLGEAVRGRAGRWAVIRGGKDAEATCGRREWLVLLSVGDMAQRRARVRDLAFQTIKVGLHKLTHKEVGRMSVASCITEYVRALLPLRVIGTRFLNYIVSKESFHQWDWLGNQAFVKRALMQVWQQVCKVTWRLLKCKLGKI